MRRRWLAAALALLPSGCQLAEVTTAPAEDILVAEAILQAGPFRQVLVLHRSVDGNVVRGERGASVWITTPRGAQIHFNEASLGTCANRLGSIAEDSLLVDATCYATPTSVRIEPGATYELHVVTESGAELRGRTTVPARFAFRAPLGASCWLRPRTNLPLLWTSAAGAWSYLSTIEVTGLPSALEGTGIQVPERLELTAISVSDADTTLVVPAQFGLFDVGNVDPDLLAYLQGGFPADVSVLATVSAIDRNYVNALRGGRFNPSGPVRISSIIGDGVGVFGSILTLNLAVEVQDRSHLPPCLP